MECRYFFDQINSSLWSILDNNKLELSYNLILTPIQNTHNMNWQVSIVEVVATKCNFNSYGLELFSNCFYALNKEYAIDIIYNVVIGYIEDYNLDIHNLKELAYEFGGLVNNKLVIMPAVSYQLYLN